jgi:hypothetical protein
MADVFRQYAHSYCNAYRPSALQMNVMNHIQWCRTYVLGGHVTQCDTCKTKRKSYNSCRDRHCSNCLGWHRKEWLDSRQAELLPVPYFHVVTTVPDSIAPVALQNKQVVYDILFRTTGETLRDIAANPKHLGAEIGWVAVLHTWGQNLLAHPHIHCIVPGGGISPDGSRWVPARKKFFLSVKVLSRHFRELFCNALEEAYHRKKLEFHGQLQHLRDPEQFRAWLAMVQYKNEWVVHAKPPYGGPEQGLKYLARYICRVAITNHRLVAISDTGVTFRYKDYKRRRSNLLMTLRPHEFIRRFLLHTLPKGFVRIRYGGFLANRHRAARLQLCRRLLQTSPKAPQPSPPPVPTLDDVCRGLIHSKSSLPVKRVTASSGSGPDPDASERRELRTVERIELCRNCNQGRMFKIAELTPLYRKFPRRKKRRTKVAVRMDSS